MRVDSKLSIHILKFEITITKAPLNEGLINEVSVVCQFAEFLFACSLMHMFISKVDT